MRLPQWPFREELHQFLLLGIIQPGASRCIPHMQLQCCAEARITVSHRCWPFGYLPVTTLASRGGDPLHTQCHTTPRSKIFQPCLPHMEAFGHKPSFTLAAIDIFPTMTASGCCSTAQLCMRRHACPVIPAGGNPARPIKCTLMIFFEGANVCFRSQYIQHNLSMSKTGTNGTCRRANCDRLAASPLFKCGFSGQKRRTSATLSSTSASRYTDERYVPQAIPTTCPS
jgi:hypothetical protein